MSRRSAASAWLIASAVVILAAAAAGLLTAYLVASMRAVPAPEGVLPSPTPSLTATAQPSASPGTTQGSPLPDVTPIPRTPTPLPTPSPTPIIHIVAAGEYLSLIADQYDMPVQALIDYNQLQKPDHIEPGQVILIPVGLDLAPYATPTP
jgi:LysM repeat protein